MYFRSHKSTTTTHRAHWSFRRRLFHCWGGPRHRTNQISTHEYFQNARSWSAHFRLGNQIQSTKRFLNQDFAISLRRKDAREVFNARLSNNNNAFANQRKFSNKSKALRRHQQISTTCWKFNLFVKLNSPRHRIRRQLSRSINARSNRIRFFKRKKSSSIFERNKKPRSQLQQQPTITFCVLRFKLRRRKRSQISRWICFNDVRCCNHLEINQTINHRSVFNGG